MVGENDPQPGEDETGAAQTDAQGRAEPRAAGGFAGWTRSHKTDLRVKIGDGLARTLITIGGFGTIISVAVMCVFLVWVVTPMFLGGSIEDEGVVEQVSTSAGQRIVHTQVDEYQTMGWTLYDDGRLRSFRLDTGETLAIEPLYAGHSIISSSFDLTSDRAAFGFEDGSIGLCEIGFETHFLDPTQDEQIAALQKQLEEHPEQEVAFRSGMVTLTNEGQLRQQILRVSSKDPVPTGSQSPVLLLDMSLIGSSTTLLSLTADGRLRLSGVRERKNLLTGKVTLITRDAELPALSVDEPMPAYLKLSGQSDAVFLIWDDGTCLRYDVRDRKAPVVAERVALLDEPAAQVTAAAFLIGKTTLLIGTSTGNLTAWHRIKPDHAETSDGAILVRYHELLADTEAAVTSIGVSQRRRMVAAGYADGSARLFYVTSDQLLSVIREGGADHAPVDEILIAPKEDGAFLIDAAGLHRWGMYFPHPEPTLNAIFGRIWYEGYSEPEYTWQSTSGSDDFEPKYSLTPLIFGTLKATIYSMVFAVPVALLAAIFTSEFLNPKWKKAIKPTVELMASLPSVVLGFLAGLVLAQLIEDIVPAVLLSFFLIPFCWLLAAHGWQLLPRHLSMRLTHWRLPLSGLVMVLGGWLSLGLGPVFESLFFAGDIKIWLDGQLGSGVGGWLLPTVPLCAIIAAVLSGRYLDPLVNDRWGAGGTTAVALAHLVKFLLVSVSVVLAALFLAWLITALGWDPRGDFLGTYVQRNALVVGMIMGFAVIPIIYTITEDALSAVPEHLRGASLGAGATQWQTAWRIVIPTAMSGIFSAIMIGFGRAVGETMIVLMAAGNTAIMDWNIFNGFRTLSANIAVELPEAVKDSTNYRMLFLAALTLFVMTFILNTVAEVVRLRFRKRAYQL